MAITESEICFNGKSITHKNTSEMMKKDATTAVAKIPTLRVEEIVDPEESLPTLVLRSFL